MSIIATVCPQDAAGEVAEVYDQMKQAVGRVPNALQLYSASPALLAMQWQYLGYYFQHPTLSFPLLASIRMLVSQENDCNYCIGMNESMLIKRAGFTPEQTTAAKRSLSKNDIEALGHLGWTEQDIFDAVNHGARNVAVDILFNTFKIENDF